MITSNNDVHIMSEKPQALQKLRRRGSLILKFSLGNSEWRPTRVVTSANCRIMATECDPGSISLGTVPPPNTGRTISLVHFISYQWPWPQLQIRAAAEPGYRTMDPPPPLAPRPSPNIWIWDRN